MPPPKRHRHGAALLEAIVALAIMAMAGITAVTLTRQAVATVERVQATERHFRAAGRFLEAVSLWPREDLELRLGDHPQGPWVLHIDRPAPTLYRVALYDSAGGRPVLETALFRPE